MPSLSPRSCPREIAAGLDYTCGASTSFPADAWCSQWLQEPRATQPSGCCTRSCRCCWQLGFVPYGRSHAYDATFSSRTLSKPVRARNRLRGCWARIRPAAGTHLSMHPPPVHLAAYLFSARKRNMERVTGLEPVASTLARSRTTNCATPAYTGGAATSSAQRHPAVVAATPPQMWPLRLVRSTARCSP